jgi:hypothetical protein
MPNDATAGLAGTILVIDDERNIRRTLRMVLEGEGATVLDAETAEQGLALIEASIAGKNVGEPAIQVVMADVLLPGMSGLQLLEKLSVMGGGSAAAAGDFDLAGTRRCRTRCGRRGWGRSTSSRSRWRATGWSSACATRCATTRRRRSCAGCGRRWCGTS